MDEKCILEELMNFIKLYPELKDANISTDYVDTDKNTTYMIAPAGFQEVQEREEDVLGNEIRYFQYNCVFAITKRFHNGVNALQNQKFIEKLQFWVIEQNYTGLTPVIGDDKSYEDIKANNGMLLELDNSASMATYQIQLQAKFIKKYERN